MTQPFFMGTQETIIYRLVLTNPGFRPYLLFSILGLKEGRGPTGTPISLGPQNSTKKLTQLVELLALLLSRNHVFNFSDLGPPFI